MKFSRWAFLFLVASVGLFGQRADAMRTPLTDVRASITQPPQLTAATAAADVPADAWLVESIIPLGTTADGQPLALISLLVPNTSLDELAPTSTRAGPYAAPKTHTRVFCIVQPPLGLEIYEADWGRGVPRGYWPYHASDSWNPLEQVAVTFGNLGSLLVNTVDLGVDKVGAAADRLRVDEIEMFFISNGTPDPGDAFFLGLAGLSRLGAIVRTADRVEDALDLVSDASRTVQRAERIVDPAHDAVRFGARYFDDLALKGTRNAHGSAVVLGKFIEDGRSYTKVAAHYKASYFKLDNWRDLTKAMNQDEIWKINEAFLRQQLKQGKRIILSHDPAKATGFFAREVSYLEALGYRFVKEGWVWKATR